MKKILLTLVAVAMTLGASAQLVLNPSFVSSVTPTETVKGPNKAQGTVWYGYYNTGETRKSIGIQRAETYDQCAYFDGSLAGKTINAIRIYFQSNKNIKNVKVWISSSLPSSADNADYVQAVSSIEGGSEGNNEGLPNDITLTTPYTITDKGIYVGYSFTVTLASSNEAKYPTLIGTTAIAENGLFLKSSRTATAWTDYSSQFGPLAIQMQLAGDYAQNAATVGTVNNVILGLNGSKTISVPVISQGTKAINSVSYTLTADGKTIETKDVTLTNAITGFGMKGYIPVTVNASASEGTQNMSIAITKVNGSTNECTNNSADFEVNTVAVLPVHRVTIEEYTGTGCGYCPRGWQGMENLRQAYGDLFVGLALHRYNSSDPMVLSTSKYPSISFSGAPSCRMERGEEIDPLYGSVNKENGILEDFQNAADVMAPVAVDVTGEWDTAKNNVKATADICCVSGGNYDIEYALIADDLHSTSTDWDQSNYYYSYSVSQAGQSMADFCKGGKYGTDKINDLHFNDVALCGSYVSGKNTATTIGTMAAGEKKQNTHTIALNINDAVKKVIDKEKVYVIVLITKDGKIVNAAKSRVVEEGATAINTANVSSEVIPVSFHSVDGKASNGLQRGMNIIRFSDGSVRKVIIK